MRFNWRGRGRPPAASGPAATSTSEPGLSGVVEASRRISALGTPPEIWREAIKNAVAMTEAEIGAFISIPEGAVKGPYRFSDQTHPEFFAAPGLTSARLRTAIEQRSADCLVVGDEPAFSVSPIAVAIAPCVGQSRLLGVLMVLRPADSPFGNSAIEVLELLGPVTGAALARVAPARSAEDVDGVTQLANRRRLDRDFGDFSREGRIGFASVKIDQLGTFAAQHSESETEDLLRQVALTVRSSIRPTDVAYRTGDDEFGILLPGATRVQTAWVAERVRQAIAAVTMTGLADANFTASIGVTSGEHDDAQELAERARTAMLEAEELGRDQVVSDDII